MTSVSNSTVILKTSTDHIRNDLYPLMLSAKRNGDLSTALMAVNMIESRLEVINNLSRYHGVDTELRVLLRHVQAIKKGLSRERGMVERVVTSTARGVGKAAKNRLSRLRTEMASAGQENHNDQ